MPEGCAGGSCFAAALICLLAFVPPLSSLAGRYESGELLRFGLWAIVVPPLVVLGTRWPNAASLAGARVRHPELVRVTGFLLRGLVGRGVVVHAARGQDDGDRSLARAGGSADPDCGRGRILAGVGGVPTPRAETRCVPTGCARGLDDVVHLDRGVPGRHVPVGVVPQLQPCGRSRSQPSGRSAGGGRGAVVHRLRWSLCR